MQLPQINFKKTALVLAIVVVFNLFVNYGIDTLYKKQPVWGDFCGEKAARQHTDQESCEEAGERWNDNREFGEPVPLKAVPANPEAAPAPTLYPRQNGWCDTAYRCGKEFESADNLYRRNVFLVWVIIGVAALAGGIILTTAEAVSLGFTFGGLLAILVGTAKYWSQMDDYLRFVILGFSLTALIWVGVKKIKD